MASDLPQALAAIEKRLEAAYQTTYNAVTWPLREKARFDFREHAPTDLARLLKALRLAIKQRDLALREVEGLPIEQLPEFIERRDKALSAILEGK